MSLMTAARRRLALVLIGLLTLPALAMPFAPLRIDSKEENRRLAPVPAWPASMADWRHAPRDIDAFLADHFGFREDMVRAANDTLRAAGGEAGSRAAVEGKDGWMFLTEGLRRSTGQELDPVLADDYAVFVCEVGDRLAARGIKAVFALAPSPAQIYPEMAPDWALPAKRPNLYDRITAGTARCGVTTVDLRLDLRAVKAVGLAYRKLDSHWTLRGSLTAYNRVAAAMDHADWRIAPESLSWATVVAHNGDLPRLAGKAAGQETVEIHDLTTLPATARRRPVEGVTHRLAAPFMIETGRAGPTVLILGDSFTADPLPPYFARFVGKVAWAHQDKCAFDWRLIEAVKPDHVLIMPVEREAACHGARPIGFPAARAAK